MIRPMTDEETKRAIERAKANSLDEYGNYGENNGPLPETKEEPELKIHAYGSKSWHLNGKLHREDGPAIEGYSGNKEWYFNGQLHREGGPAIEYTNGDKEWYLKGKLHREDGPAIEYDDGDKEWWLNGKQVTEEEVMGNKQEKYAEFVESMVLTYGQDRLAENTLGLVGEAGEVAEKVKKYFRDTTLDKEAIQKELGDVIFYWYALHGALSLNPEETISMNMEKLASRKNRGVIQGSGDNR